MARSVHAWLAFAVLAAIPAALVVVLVLRAASAERARAHEAEREERRALAASATRDAESALARAKDALRGAPESATPDAIAAALGAARPPFAEIVVLAPDGSLVFPAAPAADVPASEECARARDRLAGPERTSAREVILARCPELRAESGRHLWPLLALESGGGDPLVAWTEAHANRLSTSERVVLRERARALADPARARVLAALARDAAPRERLASIVAALGGPDEIDGALRTYRGAAVAALRVFASGLVGGYVAHEGSLAALSMSEAVTLAPGARGDGTDLRLSPQLVMHVDPRDPQRVEALARSAGTRIVVLGLGSVALSIAFAAALFARAQRAQRLAELRTDFVAAVSHELRTPLASVRMLAELLERKDVDDSERTEVEHTLAAEARRMSATLDRMLRFGALARGKLAVEKQRVAVRGIVDEAVARFRAAHAEREVVVDVDPALEADADAGLLGLVLDNLLSNAAKYAPDGGPYRVRGERSGPDVELAVTDRGPGLDARARARVFLPFERADDRLSRATEGTGVGLALVRGIAQAHGGDASVRSELGQGATFVVRFPISRESR